MKSVFGYFLYIKSNWALEYSSWICFTLGKFRSRTFGSSLLNFLATRISLRGNGLLCNSCFRKLNTSANPPNFLNCWRNWKLRFISDIWILKTRLSCLTCLNISDYLEIDWKFQNCPKLPFSVLKFPMPKFLIRQNSNTAYNVAIMNFEHKSPIWNISF